MHDLALESVVTHAEPVLMLAIAQKPAIARIVGNLIPSEYDFDPPFVVSFDTWLTHNRKLNDVIWLLPKNGAFWQHKG